MSNRIHIFENLQPFYPFVADIKATVSLLTLNWEEMASIAMSVCYVLFRPTCGSSHGKPPKETEYSWTVLKPLFPREDVP